MRKLKYDAFEGKVHMFTDKKHNVVIAVFPQNSQQAQMMPYLARQQKVTKEHVMEWCEGHGIPYQKLGKRLSGKIIAHIRETGMRPEGEK